MATDKPRITVTMTEHQHAVLKRMSGLSGESMSSIVVDMLDTVMPVLERVVATMQAAVDAPAQVRKGMVESFERAERDMLPKVTELMGQMDMLLVPGGVSAIAGAPPGTSVPKTVRKNARPPTSNRGVRIPPAKAVKANTSKASKPVGKVKKK